MRQSAETSRKIDKLEQRVDRLSDRLDIQTTTLMKAIEEVSNRFAAITDKNHTENQRWIRSVAGTLILILLAVIGGLVKAHFNL